jgi:hypothetical protein
MYLTPAYLGIKIKQPETYTDDFSAFLTGGLGHHPNPPVTFISKAVLIIVVYSFHPIN